MSKTIKLIIWLQYKCLYKANYMSEPNTKSLDAYSVFKAEIAHNYIIQANSKQTKYKCFLDKVVQLL